MSLVIGVIENGEVSLSADTKLTPGAAWATDQPKEGLKIFFLDREIAVSYSGTLLTAHPVICECAQLRANGSTVQDILSFIAARRSRLRSDLDLDADQLPDFLIAVASATPELYRVSGDHLPVLAGSLSCIGDNNAVSHFRSFAEHYSAISRSIVRDGLLRIIRSPDHPTVGGYAVTARGKQAGFTFLAEMSLTSPYYPPLVGPDWQTVDFGTAESGGFGFVSIVPAEPGRNGYGFYFYQGRHGVFYHCDLMKNRFQRLTGFAASASEFAKLIGDTIGYETEAFAELGLGNG